MTWLHVVVDAPAPVLDVEGSFWSGVLGWEQGQPWTGHSRGRGVAWQALEELKSGLLR